MKFHFSAPRSVIAAILLAVVLAASGCAGSHYSVDFSMTDSNFKSRGKSIAVISGTKEPLNVALAAMVSESLQKKSHYQVAPPAQVARAIAPYPQSIKGPYKSAYFSIDTDWDLSDRNRIADIQRALNVDYLYVIWAPIAVQYNRNEIANVPARAQLFEKPGAKEVAQTYIGLLVGDEKDVYLKEGVDEIARQLAENTRMAIAKKK